MIHGKAKYMRWGLDALYFSQLYRLFIPQWSGVGVIFTLHHVRKREFNSFSPNSILEITPEFLDATIQQVLNSGYEVISLNQAKERLQHKDFKKKFACFTLDDGYKDNYINALPVFQKYSVPFTIYINTGLPDGQTILWWWLLEHIVQQHDSIECNVNKQTYQLACKTIQEKYRAFELIYWKLRQLPLGQQYEDIVGLLQDYEVDWQNFCKNSALSWQEIAELAKNPLVTIGSHTINHFALSKLSREQVIHEAQSSRELIADKIGYDPIHFSYPFGDPTSAASREFEIIESLGFATATTTRKGMLFPQHNQYLHALPRVSLNGYYQLQRYVKLFLSGAPFAIWQKFKPLNIH